MKTEKNSTTLTEFMQVMQPRTKKGRSWANEDVAESASAPVPSSSTSNVRISAPTPATKAKVKKPKTDSGVVSIDEPQVEVEEPRDEAMSDLDWMKRRMQRGINDPTASAAFEQSDGNAEDQEHEEEVPSAGEQKVEL
jgi:multiple RNA-binding domain-containing protein 1